MTLPWNRSRLEEVWRWPHVFWLNIFGLWAEDASTPASRRWLSRYRVLVLFHVILMFLSTMVAIGDEFAKGDIMTNMFTVFASGPAAVGIFKTFHIIFHRKELKSAMNYLDGMLNEVDSLETEIIMRKGLKRCWKVFTISLTSGSCITIHWLSRPLLVAILYKEKTRVIETWPVFIETWAQFVASYAFQCPGVICLGHIFYFFDNIYFCISTCILCHLEILQYKIENIKLSGKENKSPELISCIKYHINILRACNKLKDASTSVIFWQCFNTVIMACSGVFILTMSAGLSTNILMNLGEIILIITFSLYFYCWFSNEITLQCSNVMKSSYLSNWTCGSSSSKKTLQILMTRAMLPMTFGGILEISLSTFITVLKTTFSYYNFLIAVNETNDPQ